MEEEEGRVGLGGKEEREQGAEWRATKISALHRVSRI